MGLHVLLVEDDDLLRGLTARILRSLGHDVHEAGDGPGAMAAISADSSFDVVFADVKLGGGFDGMELARRALVACDWLQVVLTSGDPSTFRASAELGSRVTTLAKPYRKDQLQALLESVGERTPPSS